MVISIQIVPSQPNVYANTIQILAARKVCVDTKRNRAKSITAGVNEGYKSWDNPPRPGFPETQLCFSLSYLRDSFHRHPHKYTSATCFTAIDPDCRLLRKHFGRFGRHAASACLRVDAKIAIFFFSSFQKAPIGV